jgi:hypothetical protein
MNTARQQPTLEMVQEYLERTKAPDNHEQLFRIIDAFKKSGMRDTRGTMAQVARLFRKSEHPDPIKFILDFNMFLPSADNMDIFLTDSELAILGVTRKGADQVGQEGARQKEERLERRGGGQEGD